MAYTRSKTQISTSNGASTDLSTVADMPPYEIGDTPASIDLTKTLTYSGDDLTGIGYS